MSTADTTPIKRPRWGSQLGIILAVAGSAVGLGNFLRFPAQAALNGGGAFMIPYFVSLFLLGIPLMWIEWSVGRYGGLFGHGTAPGMFHVLGQKRWIKYLGVIGIFGPLVIFSYYLYIESWLVGYSFFSLTGKYLPAVANGSLDRFLAGYQGIMANEYFASIIPAFCFFLFTFAINMFIISGGIAKGIEKLCNIAMPLLFIMAIFIVARVLTLPPAVNPDWTIAKGLGYLWNPDFSALLNAKVWLAAAGQIFFTLSVGIGVILTYASYLSKQDDVVQSGLTSASINEFAEVILGGSLIIPAAFVFFGPDQITEIVKSGMFNIGFVTMPNIFSHIALGSFFAFMWFFLLFLAGLTSSISLIQPVVAFLEDEFGLKRKTAVLFTTVLSFLLCLPAIFFLKHGVVDELDFWGGTFALVLFATIESILFVWVFGIDKAWQEIHHGAQMQIPRFYRFIIKYITPTFLIAILIGWLWQGGIDIILLKNVSPENLPYVIGTRLMLVTLFVLLAVMVKLAWRNKKIRPHGQVLEV